MPWVRRPSARPCPGYAGPQPAPALGTQTVSPRLPWVRGPSALACPGYTGRQPTPGLGYAGPQPSPALGTRDLSPRLAWVRGPPARPCPRYAGRQPAPALGTRASGPPVQGTEKTLSADASAHHHPLGPNPPPPACSGHGKPAPPAGRRASIFKIRYYCGRVANPLLPYTDDMIDERRES